MRIVSLLKGIGIESPYSNILVVLLFTLVLGFIIYQLWKRTKLFKNLFSLTVLGTLLFFTLIAIIGFNLIWKESTNFYGVYYSVIVLSLVAGIVYTIILNNDKISWSSKSGFWKEFLVSVSILIGVIVIAIIIHALRPEKGKKDIDIWLLNAFIPYVMPLIFYKSFLYWMNIPARSFKSWQYPAGRTLPKIELVDTTLIHIDLKRSINDLDLISSKIRAPRHERFSDVMFYFLHKFNNEKYPGNQIEIYENYDEQIYYKWIFYTKQSSGVSKLKQYFDPDKKIIDLGLKNNQHVIAQRLLK